MSGINAQPVDSLRETGEDLIGLHRLDVPSTLNRSFLSTDNIENVMLNLKRHLGRVKRWRREPNAAERWVASGLAIAGKGFRRIKHYDELPHLIAALQHTRQNRRNRRNGGGMMLALDIGFFASSKKRSEGVVADVLASGSFMGPWSALELLPDSALSSAMVTSPIAEF